MTQNLSWLIANAVGNASVERSAAQTESRATRPLDNAALANATALSNSAKATIARLPEHILSIATRLPHSGSTGTTSQTINLQVPADVYQQTIQHARLSLIKGSETNAKSTTPETLALLSAASQTQSSVSVSRSELDALIKAIEQALLKNTAIVSMKGTLSQRPDGQLALTTAQGNVLNIPDANGATEQALRKLVGQSVTLSLVKGTGNVVSLNIQSDKAASPPLSLPVSLSIGGKSAQGEMIKADVILGALRQGAVAVDTTNATILQRILPTSVVQTQNVLQSTARLTLTESVSNDAQQNKQLTAHVAQRKALVTFTAPQSVNGTLAAVNIANVKLNTLPTGKVIDNADIKLSASQTSGQQQMAFNYAADKATNPESLKGSDVHQAISTLSRVLLSQTGNTKDALTQLLALVQGRGVVANATNGPTSNNDTTNALSKVLQQITSIDASTAKPAGPINLKAQESAQATVVKTENVKQADVKVGKSESTQNRTLPLELSSPQNVIKNALQSDTIKNESQSLASLAASIGAQAKTFSNSALANVFQKFTQNAAKQFQPSAASTSVESDLKPEATDAKNTQTSTKVNTAQFLQDISQQPLPERIQQVLSSAALVTTSTTLTTPVSQSGFVQGLVTLLQLALAGRALQRQPSLKSLIDMPDSVIAKTLNNLGVSTTPSRVSQDVNQLDTRQQLLSQLKTLLAGHQQTKLNNAETRIQGQDAFYYVLPSLSQTQAPTELLIHREKERQNKQKETQDSRSLWNVTMKLDIGDTGQVLAKSKIAQDTITLNLYASNEVILHRIADTLPYLTKRLSSLGLEVTEANYQRGQVPDTLNTRPHQIFETRV